MRMGTGACKCCKSSAVTCHCASGSSYLLSIFLIEIICFLGMSHGSFRVPTSITFYDYYVMTRVAGFLLLKYGRILATCDHQLNGVKIRCPDTHCWIWRMPSSPYNNSPEYSTAYCSVGSRAPTVRSLRMSILLFCTAREFYQVIVSSALVTIWSPAFLQNRLPSADLPYSCTGVFNPLKFVHCRPRREEGTWNTIRPTRVVTSIVVPNFHWRNTDESSSNSHIIVAAM